MKAVVVDIQGKYAVVLGKNGDFIKVSNKKNYKLGYEVDIPANNVVNMYVFTRIASVAAVVLLVLGIGFGAFAYNNPYSYIDIDINPSVEITANMFDRIIKIKAINRDGERVISGIRYRNLKIEDGIGNILKAAAEKGYLKAVKGESSENTDTLQNTVMFTISGKSGKKVLELKGSLQHNALKDLKEAKIKSDIIVENISKDKHDKAAGMGISPGKMLLIEKLQEQSPEVKVENYKNAPVRDIMKAIKAQKDKKEKKNSLFIEDKRKTDSSDNPPEKTGDPIIQTTEQEKDKAVKPRIGKDINKLDNNKGSKPDSGKKNKGHDKPEVGGDKSAAPKENNGKTENKAGKKNSKVQGNSVDKDNSEKPGKGNKVEDTGRDENLHNDGTSPQGEFKGENKVKIDNPDNNTVEQVKPECGIGNGEKNYNSGNGNKKERGR